MIDWEEFGLDVVEAIALATLADEPDAATRALSAIVVERLLRRAERARDWLDAVPEGALVLDLARDASLDALAATFGLERFPGSGLFDAETDLELRERVRRAAERGPRA